MSTFTPNLDLELQVHAAPDWDTPLNSNFTKLDNIVGGGTTPGTVLTSNGPGTPPTYQPPATPGTGTVTSVGLSVPGEFQVAGSPVTSSGTLGVSKNTQNANQVWAGPTTGAAAQPQFRSLVAADIPFQLPNINFLPGWWGSGDGAPWMSSSISGNGQWATNAGANIIKFWTIRIPYTISISKLSYVQNAALGGSVSGYGMYDSTGQTKIFSWDNVPTGTGGGLKTNILSPAVSLPPGMYLVACGCSLIMGGGGQPATGGGYGTAGTNEGGQPWNANGTVRTGFASNPLAAGVMPAALGTLSVTGSMGITVPLVIMEP